MAFLQDVGHGHVQRNQRDVPVGGQDLGGGLGVVVDVGLGHGGDVARGQGRPAHHSDRIHQRGQRRFQPEGFGDVGQRADGQHPQRARVFVGEPDQHLGRGLGRKPGRRRRQRNPADAVVPVHPRRPSAELPGQRIVGAERHGNVRVAGELEQVKGVAGADGGTDVAADGPDPHNVGRGRGEQVGQGEGVVDPGIAVQVERVAGGGHGGVSLSLEWGGQRVSPLGAATKRLTMNAAAVMATEIQRAVA